MSLADELSVLDRLLSPRLGTRLEIKFPGGRTTQQFEFALIAVYRKLLPHSS